MKNFLPLLLLLPALATAGEYPTLKPSPAIPANSPIKPSVTYYGVMNSAPAEQPRAANPYYRTLDKPELHENTPKPTTNCFTTVAHTGGIVTVCK